MGYLIGIKYFHFLLLYTSTSPHFRGKLVLFTSLHIFHNFSYYLFSRLRLFSVDYFNC